MKMDRLARTLAMAAYVGLMLVILLPDLDFTNSLLMKRPVGCRYFSPLGAVSSIERSVMILIVRMAESKIGRTERIGRPLCHKPGS